MRMLNKLNNINFFNKLILIYFLKNKLNHQSLLFKLKLINKDLINVWNKLMVARFQIKRIKDLDLMALPIIFLKYLLQPKTNFLIQTN
jgi:hypothetical protein